MSGNKCIYKGCGKSRYNCPNLKLFSIPLKDPDKLQMWIDNSGNNGSSPSAFKGKLVCEDHFLIGDFINILKKRLICSAVPQPYFGITEKYDMCSYRAKFSAQQTRKQELILSKECYKNYKEYNKIIDRPPDNVERLIDIKEEVIDDDLPHFVNMNEFIEEELPGNFQNFSNIKQELIKEELIKKEELLSDED